MLSPLTRRPVTLKDIAKQAGVSVMAVSTVLSGTKSTVGVSEATRERILEIAQGLDYRPNAFARSLRMKRIGTIGLLHGAGLLRTDDPVIRDLFNGISAVLAANDLDLLVYCGINVQDAKSVQGIISSRKTDALIIMPTIWDISWVRNFVDSRIPIVLVSDKVEGFQSLHTDDAGGARLMVQHLTSKGHKHILYRRASFSNAAEEARFQALKASADEAGCILTVTRAKDIRDRITEEEEQLELNRLSENGITAVACWRDLSAERVLNYCLSQHIAVPQDLAIVGFDGVGRHVHSSGRTITTINANWHGVGEAAASLVVTLLRPQSNVQKPKQVPATLSLGDTT